MRAIRTSQHKVNQVCYVQVLKVLLTQPSTHQYELTELTGLRLVTVRDLLRAYYREGCLHIVGWLPNARGAPTTPIFALGPGEDAPKPLKSVAQIKADFRAKRKVESERKLALRSQVESDPLLSVLHGIATKPDEESK